MSCGCWRISSGDPLLVRAYRNNEDIHTLTASEVFGVPAETHGQGDAQSRQGGEFRNRVWDFGVRVGGAVGDSAGRRRSAYIERYFARYEGVKAVHREDAGGDAQDGSVRTMFGRVRPIPDIESRNPNQRGFAERTAVNTPLQGTAADLIKLAMIALDRKLAERKLKTRMVLQVHDELLFEVPTEETGEVEELVRAEMEGVVELNVPLVADVGVWAELAGFVELDTSNRDVLRLVRSGRLAQDDSSTQRSRSLSDDIAASCYTPSSVRMASAMASAVVVHGGFAFGFDHDAGQGFGAGVADDDAAGVFQVLFGGVDGGGDGGDGVEGLLLADLYVDDDLREDLEVGGELVDDWPVRAMRSRTTSAVSRPSPVVARCGKRMWPDCSPPSAALCCSICSST